MELLVVSPLIWLMAPSLPRHFSTEVVIILGTPLIFIVEGSGCKVPYS